LRAAPFELGLVIGDQPGDFPLDIAEIGACGQLQQGQPHLLGSRDVLGPDFAERHDAGYWHRGATEPAHQRRQVESRVEREGRLDRQQRQFASP